MGPVGGCFHGEQESSSAGGHPTTPSLRDPAEMETHVCPCDSPHPWHKGLARPLSGAGAPASRMPPPNRVLHAKSVLPGQGQPLPTSPYSTLHNTFLERSFPERTWKGHFPSPLPCTKCGHAKHLWKKKNITIIPLLIYFFSISLSGKNYPLPFSQPTLSPGWR